MTKCDFCVCFQPEMRGESLEHYKCWSDDMNNDCQTAIRLMTRTLSQGTIRPKIKVK